jgi:hypothetical protein
LRHSCPVRQGHPPALVMNALNGLAAIYHGEIALKSSS